MVWLFNFWGMDYMKYLLIVIVLFLLCYWGLSEQPGKYSYGEGIYYNPDNPDDPFGEKEHIAKQTRQRLDGTYRGIIYPFEGISTPIRKPTQEELEILTWWEWREGVIPDFKEVTVKYEVRIPCFDKEQMDRIAKKVSTFVSCDKVTTTQNASQTITVNPVLEKKVEADAE